MSHFHCVSASPILLSNFVVFRSLADSFMGANCDHENFAGPVLLFKSNSLFHAKIFLKACKKSLSHWIPCPANPEIHLSVRNNPPWTHAGDDGIRTILNAMQPWHCVTLVFNTTTVVTPATLVLWIKHQTAQTPVSHRATLVDFYWSNTIKNWHITMTS